MGRRHQKSGTDENGQIASPTRKDGEGGAKSPQPQTSLSPQIQREMQQKRDEEHVQAMAWVLIREERRERRRRKRSRQRSSRRGSRSRKTVRDLAKGDPKMMKWMLQRDNLLLEWHAPRHKVVVGAQLVHRPPLICAKALVVCFNEEGTFHLVGGFIL